MSLVLYLPLYLMSNKVFLVVQVLHTFFLRKQIKKSSKINQTQECTCQGVPAWVGVPACGMYLPVACSCLGVYLVGEGVPAQAVYLPGGCTYPGGVPTWGCTWPGGVPAGIVPHRGVPTWGVYLARGVPAQEGVPAQILPPMNRILDTCY